MKQKQFLVLALFSITLISGCVGNAPDSTSYGIGNFSNVSVTYVSINETDMQESGYLFGRYPVLVGLADNDVQNKINSNIYNHILSDISNTKTEVNQLCIGSKVDKCISSDNLDAEATLSFRLGTVSVLETQFVQGNAFMTHPYTTFYSAVYRLKDGSLLKLDDLFRKDTDYLKNLADFSNTELHKTFEYASIENVAPSNESFKHFIVRDDGLLIQFEEYQLGSRLVGTPQVLIPWNQLKDVSTTQN